MIGSVVWTYSNLNGLLNGKPSVGAFDVRVRIIRNPHSESRDFYAVAITLSSIAMGVGRQLISRVVRAGLGLPLPAKYSA